LRSRYDRLEITDTRAAGSGVGREISERGLARNDYALAAEKAAIDLLELVERPLAGGRQLPEHTHDPCWLIRNDRRVAAARHQETPAGHDGGADLARGGATPRHVDLNDIGTVREVATPRRGRAQ